MSRTSIDDQKRKIFGARFTEQFHKWQEEGRSKGETRTQISFGKLITPEASRGSVMKWCRGDNIPTPDRIKQICEIFGVPEDHFDTDNATHDELYRNSSNFIEGIGKKHVEFSKLIGLDLDLIRSLSYCINFDELFPLYSPIDHEMIDPETNKKIYDREVDFQDSAHVEDVDENLRFLQVEKDEKRITFHRCDLAFLKEIQDQVVDFVEFLFYKRSKEMEEEVIKFNEDLEHEYVKPDGETDIEHRGITKDYYINHDRFARYNYLFKDEPKPDWYFIYKDKPRKATQEDWDRLFNTVGTEISKEEFDKITSMAKETHKEGK